MSGSGETSLHVFRSIDSVTFISLLLVLLSTKAKLLISLNILPGSCMKL